MNRRICLSLFFILLICFSLMSQTDKIRIALVSQVDAGFALLKCKENPDFLRYRTEYTFVQSEIFDFDIKEKWLEFFRMNLDSDKYEIRFEAMPEEVKDNYLFSIYKGTNGFGHASSKLKKWFSELYENNGYDIVIMLFKAILDSRYSAIFELNQYPPCGVIQNENWIYSLYNINVYQSRDGKILFRKKSGGYNDYLRTLKKVNLSKLSFNEITEEDLEPAIDEIVMMNSDVGRKICKRIIAYSN
ncbi:MAG: hypothetical protein PHH37_02870 [Paludibacter sp.]|nr:hypothetical protein [Paludibacter sp.]